MSKTILDLPDELMWKIFKLFPLHELFRLFRQVCSSWRLLLLRDELPGRHTLVLLSHVYDDLDVNDYILDEHHCDLLKDVRKDDGSPWFRVPTDEQLRYNWMSAMYGLATEAAIEMNPFPNITDLTLIEYHITLQNYQKIFQLIRHWSPNLITLRLKLYFEICKPKEKMDDLLKMVLAVFEVLNSIPSLRHLYLHIVSQGMFPTGTTSYREWITLPANFRLPFLSQLHTICFKTDGITGIEACLLETLNAIECTDLNQICFHNLMCNFGGKHRNLCTELLQLSPQIKGKFKKIKLTKDRYYFHNEIVGPVLLDLSSTKNQSLTMRPQEGTRPDRVS